ncbi:MULTISPECIES: hypothetical protein [unclassified Exiguobacterium]|uniref:hypothetical protein n=1 Tax=unclassified Exiguobacterium TaxID=2644629 RepID=UPI001BE5EBDD|nr:MULTISPECIES: hypothetical protein [unclassified Exiguobacterium]
MDMAEYKTLSIYAKDYDTIMKWGFGSGYNGAEVISTILEFHKTRILSNRERELEFIYYVSDEHKELFEKHLAIDQFSNYTNDILLCFYINSLIGIFTKDLEKPMEWLGKWNEEHTVFKESAKYKKLEIEKKRLIEYANVLLYETDPLVILKMLSRIDNDNVVVAQEMLRLKLLKL